MVGFGSWTVEKRKAHTGRNPRTGEEIQIPAKKVIKFKLDGYLGFEYTDVSVSTLVDHDTYHSDEIDFESSKSIKYEGLENSEPMSTEQDIQNLDINEIELDFERTYDEVKHEIAQNQKMLLVSTIVVIIALASVSLFQILSVPSITNILILLSVLFFCASLLRRLHLKGLW